MVTLLITGAGGPAGRALGNQLDALGSTDPLFRWVGVDIVELHDPDYPVTDLVPRADDPAYPVGMRTVFERHRPDLILPTVTEELPQIAVLAEALKPHTRASAPHGPVVVSSAAATAIAGDKLLTMWALDAAGVAVPRYAPATDFPDVATALAWAGGPLVVKPRASRGGRGVVLVERPTDLDWAATDSSHIVQTFAAGTEYNPQVYRSPRTGEATVIVLRKTVLKQGRVGNAAATERLADGAAPEIATIAVAAAEALDLVGPLDLDVRLDDDGTPRVLEVNARFGANSAHAPELLGEVLGEWLG